MNQVELEAVTEVYNSFLEKELEKLSEKFSYAGDLERLINHSDQRIGYKLKYDRYRPGRGAIKKWHDNVLRYEQAGGKVNADAYVKVMKDSRVEELADYQAEFFDELLKHAANNGLTESRFELLEHALTCPLSINVGKLRRKYLINGESLTTTESIALKASLLSSMKDKYALTTVNPEEVNKLMSAGMFEEAQALLQQQVVKQSGFINQAVNYFANMASAEPVGDQAIAARQAYVQRIVDYINDR